MRQLISISCLLLSPLCAASQSVPSQGNTTDIASGFAASRTACAAPCAVTFDATATSARSTNRPFHDIRYMWDFGDPVDGRAPPCGTSIDRGTGFWACGAKPGSNSKNAAEGPVAAHIFENAGTYSICLTAQNQTGITPPTCLSITVTDISNTVWAGKNTVCFSTSGNFGDCPPGSDHVKASGDFCSSFNWNKGAHKRYLLRRGETFTVSSSCHVDVDGPSLLGAYGAGSKPILNAPDTVTIFGFDSDDGTHQTSDWRFQDLDLRANAIRTFAFAGKMANTVLIDRLNFSGMNKNLAFPGTTETAEQRLSSHFVVQDVVSNGLFSPCGANGENAFLASIEAAHYLGLYINNQNRGEHGIRNHWMRKGSITNSTVTGICAGKAPITVRGAIDGSKGLPSGPLYNEQIVIADNYIVGSSGSGTISFGPQNKVSTEKGRDMTIERNFIDGSAGSAPIDLYMTDVTVRNNLLYGLGSAVFIQYGNKALDLPVPTNINVYNNSLYSTGNRDGSNFVLFIANSPGIPSQVGVFADKIFNFKNNIWYCPHCIGGQFYRDPHDTTQGASIASTNNTSFSVDPLFAITPPTTPAAFVPTRNSPVIGQGVSVPSVYSDFFGSPLPSAPDVGAVQHR